jgi:antitoxin component YwqK of YwqJK toxin-antitoxin module
MLSLLPCGGTLCSLNNNIIDYILNPYLLYYTDVIKLKQLYLFKFSLKGHLKFKTINKKYPNSKTKIIYFEGIKYKKENFYENGQIECRKHYLNGKLHGPVIYYDQYGISIYEDEYENGKLIFSQQYGPVTYMEDIIMN